MRLSVIKKGRKIMVLLVTFYVLILRVNPRFLTHFFLIVFLHARVFVGVEQIINLVYPTPRLFFFVAIGNSSHQTKVLLKLTRVKKKTLSKFDGNKKN